MGYYAAFLDVTDKRCLVVGGGPAAADKARGLLASGARVEMVWPVFEQAARELAESSHLVLLEMRFEESLVEGCTLVIDASGDDPVGVEVARAARAGGVLVNVLDRVPLCDFIAPALVRRGPLQIAVSTEGRSPFMASFIRGLLERWFTTEWGQLVESVGELRDRLRAEGVPLEEQQRIYRRIPGSGALRQLRQGDAEGARATVNGCAAGARAAEGVESQ